jgi:putative peptide zinc metalloprotease protein
LIAVPVHHRHESAIVIKDPIAMKYTRLRDDEYFVLNQLDGTTSLDQICKRYGDKYGPVTVKPARINELLFRFHQNGLLVSSSIGQSEALAKRAKKKRHDKLIQTLMTPLFIRFPGIDPDRFLGATLGYVRPLFHPIALMSYTAFVLAALIAFASEFSSFMAETSDMDRWFRLESILLLGAVIGTTKILHELGHAYVCKFFGGECHTIGPMLLLFSPALYCDTTDSWLLPSRWQRAAVGAAGIGVELVLAALATFVWLNTPDGLLHFAAMNVMLVCSVSTLVFNGNPLLRYDGYYVLSDLCDVPNLGQKSQQLLSSTLVRLCLTGGGPKEAIENPAKSAMLFYAAAAWVYRWSLTLMIFFIVSRMLRPIGLESIGVSLGVFAAAGALYSAARPAFGFVMYPLKRRKVEMKRLMMTAIAAAMVVTLLSYPLPARVSTVATLIPSETQSVFVCFAGFVESIAKPGERVQEGQVIAKLRNPVVELDYATALGKLNNQSALVESLERAELNDAAVSEQLPAARTLLEALTDRYEIHRARKESLEIRATRDGIILPGESKRASDDDEERLSEWIDLVTDDKNIGCFVSSGTEILQIAAADSYEAELLLSQSVAKRVRQDAPVKVCLAASPGEFQYGKVIDVSRRKMSDREGDVDATEAKSSIVAGTSALDVSYLVRVRLDSASNAMSPGQQGQALVKTVPMSIASRLHLVLAGLVRMR